MSYSSLANPRATRGVLQEFGLSAKHALGQNFLVDDNVIGNILHLAHLDDPQLDEELPTLLEIGPGIGTLTIALLERAKLIAVERDRDLLDVLAQTTADLSHRLVLIEKDALKLTRDEVERAATALDAPLPHQLVSNLPYGIAATVVLDWLERFDFLEAMTVMVQSEVADRMCAEVGTKNYGAYTVKLRLRAHVTDRFQVPPGCFMPAPHVESAVIRIERNENAPAPELLEVASALADAAFAQRRKTIRNSMSGRYPKDVVDRLLAECDIAPTVRGETLTPDVYLQMAHAFLGLNLQK